MYANPRMVYANQGRCEASNVHFSINSYTIETKTQPITLFPIPMSHGNRLRREVIGFPKGVNPNTRD
ncbi:hypothetical protein [Algoriphagus sp. NG3]|uniref:hypothetical protein n=1 Tax=Algoriphagus sp. NG3 TaxID=3097546 RepID=UPI002A7F9E63|nr:hypothetical protein [Algoriphagus sp. NG3]WPR73389.1 hypothetical protein SLW71_11940 [Algoriphagus sp. NG3]